MCCPSPTSCSTLLPYSMCIPYVDALGIVPVFVMMLLFLTAICVPPLLVTAKCSKKSKRREENTSSHGSPMVKPSRFINQINSSRRLCLFTLSKRHTSPFSGNFICTVSAFLPSRKIIHVRNIIHHLSPHLQFTIPCLTTYLNVCRLSTSERRSRKGIILPQVFCTRGSKFMPSNDSKDGQDRSQGCTGKEGFCFYRCYVQEEAQQDDDGKEPTSNRYSKSSSSSSATIYQVQQ